MIVTIKVSNTDFIQIDTDNIECEPLEAETRYSKSSDKKWIKFCKDHNFNPIKDANGKIYDLYLDFCINHLI